MTQKEVFELVIRKLEELQVRYMVCGSVCAMVYGKPRMTNDMDVVISIPPSNVRHFCETFEACGFYCPPAEADLEGLKRCGRFNLIQPDACVKVDCMVLKAEPFEREEFARRQRQALTETVEAWLACPEDVIVKKLEYFKQGGSAKHIEDIQNMLEVSGNQMDFDYLNRWIRGLALEKEWKQVQLQ